MFSGPLRESLGMLSKMEVLALSSNNFEGVVTVSHLFNLSSLQFLDLSHNSLLTLNCSTPWIPPFQLIAIFLSQCKIGPRFPQWLQFQRKLEFLDISFSQIVDTIPSWFSNLPSTLVYLNASNNQMHGILPNIEFSILNPSNSLSRSHKVLDLSRNQITGPATFLCQNELWSFIDLSNNRFSGHLPSCFTNFTLLQFLNLANNHFSGYIPNSIGSLRDLFSLNLRNNSLSGGIPTSLRKCTKLGILDLGENRLTGNIQSWMGDSLSSLSILSLPFNEFRGIIPWSMCNLKNIQVLDLSSNKISGSIPKCLHNLTTMTVKTVFLWVWEFEYPDLEDLNQMKKSFNEGPYVTWKGKEVKCASGLVPVKLLDLSNNLLAGDIPDAITKLVGLNALNLSRNNLSGRIPPDIGTLKYLDSLDLSRNHLSGGIPVSLSELSFLGVLNLSYNNLSGRIPPQILKFDESAYTGNPGLCGRPILDKSCPGEDYQDSNFDSDGNVTNNLENEEDKFITRGFYISMGFGFIVGFLGFFGTVLIKMRVEHNKARLRRYLQTAKCFLKV